MAFLPQLRGEGGGVMSHTNLVLGSWKPGEWPEHVTVSHEGMREAGRRYVPERTCRNLSSIGWKFTCSECHSSIRPGESNMPSYCPSCGARVVSG